MTLLDAFPVLFAAGAALFGCLAGCWVTEVGACDCAGVVCTTCARRMVHAITAAVLAGMCVVAPAVVAWLVGRAA